MIEDEEKILKILTGPEGKNHFSRKEFYQKIDQIIADLNKSLFFLWYKQNYRLREKKQGKRSISHEQLEGKFEQYLKEIQKDGDSFYFPALLFTTPDGDFYFNDRHVYPTIKYILSEETTPLAGESLPLLKDLLPRLAGIPALKKDLTLTDASEIIEFRIYLLSIKKALHLMSKDSGSESEIGIRERKLLLLIYQIYDLTNRVERDFEKKDRKRIKNREIAQSKIDKKLCKIKQHEKYSDISKIIADCQGKPNPTQKKELNRLIKEAGDIESQKTILRYRKILLQKPAEIK